MTGVIEVKPGRKPRTVLSQKNEVMHVPPDWVLLPPGDATLTRRVKSAADTCWLVKEKVRKRMMSKGIWVSGDLVAAERKKLETERADPSYEKRLQAGRARRAKQEEAYRASFYQEILDFLAFDATHTKSAEAIARAVTDHATPVGSGTVARTKRISIERRAEAAVIAWMRHATTAYDNMSIPRRKGARREVRAKLAARSRRLLDTYREGLQPSAECPLQQAIGGTKPG